MSVLDQLFNGEINPIERFVRKGSTYDKASRAMVESTEKLLALLNNEEKELFDKVRRKTSDLWEIEGKEWFIEGFRIGLQIAWEVWHYESPNFRD